MWPGLTPAGSVWHPCGLCPAASIVERGDGPGGDGKVTSPASGSGSGLGQAVGSPFGFVHLLLLYLDLPLLWLLLICFVPLPIFCGWGSPQFSGRASA